jgi:SOS regulatory protein LexA
MKSAKRLDWRHRLETARRRTPPSDGAIAVAFLVLPWVVALLLWLLWLRRHALDVGAAAAVISIFAAASLGLPVVWLAWVPVRNANRSGTAGSASPTGTHGPALDAGLTAAATAVRVSEADPRVLGKHAAITGPEVADDVIPAHVLRDVNAAESGVRAKMAPAARRGGFVLSVCRSSREDGQTRTIVEPSCPATPVDGDDVVEVPLIGQIPAGVPFAVKSAKEAFLLPLRLVGHGDLFALKVKGDSMTGATITDGDVVVVRRQLVAESGDIVAAQLDETTAAEATVRTLQWVDGHVWLMPANPAYEPIPADDAVILGKVVAIVRPAFSRKGWAKMRSTDRSKSAKISQASSRRGS